MSAFDPSYTAENVDGIKVEPHSSRTPIETVEEILDELNGRNQLAPSSFKLYAGVARGFARYCEMGRGLNSLNDVTVDLVLEWLEAPKPNANSAPAMSTRRVRLSALRMLYECGWSMGLLPVDPTRHIRLPGRSGTSARPLTDDEIETCRVWAHEPRGSTHRGVVWALAEAGGSPRDIACVRIKDVDLGAGTVRFPRSTRNRERVLPFSDWGLKEVRTYLACAPKQESGYLVRFPSSDLDARASDAGMAMIAVLAQAGVSGGDVKPRSIIVWAARRYFAACGRIELVAARFGTRSLDAAAQLVGLEWASGGE